MNVTNLPVSKVMCREDFQDHSNKCTKEDNYNTFWEVMEFGLEKEMDQKDTKRYKRKNDHFKTLTKVNNLNIRFHSPTTARTKKIDIEEVCSSSAVPFMGNLTCC